MSTNLEALQDGYFSVIGMIALIGVPTALGIAATAELFVPVLLGPKWLDTIEVIQVLAVAGSISILATSIGSICIAAGKPKYLIPLAGVYVIILLPLLLVLTPRYQGLGAAWAYFGAAAISLPVQLYIVLRLLGATVRELIGVLWRPLIASATMFIALDVVAGELQTPAALVGQALQLAAIVGLGVMVYVVVVFILWRQTGRPAGAETAVAERIRNLAGRSDSK